MTALGSSPVPDSAVLSAPLPPRYPIEDLFALVNPDIRKPFSMVEVLLRLVDDSRLSIFKPSYGRNLLTSFAQIMGQLQSTTRSPAVWLTYSAGHRVGIVANQVPVINTDEASKGAQFIRLCNQS